MALLLLVAIWLGVRFRLAATRAKRLEQQDEVLLHDVDTMQAALVPEVPARLEGLAVSVAYRPADGPAAGGDFYDVFVPRPGNVAIVLGDVCGHGRDAVGHAALTRYTLRAYLQAGLEPRAALGLAGEVLAEPGSFRYATVALAIYDAQSGTLTYANAGHPPPITFGFRACPQPTSCASPPIGWGVPTGRRQTKISLPAGGKLCFFSDGLSDARRAGELLGRERLVEILRWLGPRPVAAQLLEQVRAEAETTPDDMAACILAPEAVGEGTYTHVEELEADARALSGTQVWGFLEECRLPAAAIAHALERARDTVAEFETAVLAIHLAPMSATVIVTPPEPGTREATLRQHQGSRVPLLQALPGT
jgi:Stage II sporulation protein E (SpoIIE)